MAKSAAPTPAELGEVAFGCACVAVRRTARSLTRAYDEALRPGGLRITQFSILVAAELAGSATVGRLAEVLGLDRTTLTRDLRLLSERGLVDVRIGEDRRSRTVELTDAGRTAMADALPRWRAVQARVVGDRGLAARPGFAKELVRLEKAARE